MSSAHISSNLNRKSESTSFIRLRKYAGDPWHDGELLGAIYLVAKAVLYMSSSLILNWKYTWAMPEINPGEYSCIFQGGEYAGDTGKSHVWLDSTLVQDAVVYTDLSAAFVLFL